MNEVYFENIEQVGSLSLDYIFYEFEKEPILFTCEDCRKRLFLCLCSDIRYEQRWLVIQSNISTLRELVEEKTDIASVFLKCASVTSVVMDRHGNESSHIIGAEELDRLDLPKEGTFLRCDKERAQDYLWRKELELLLLKVEDSVGMGTIMGTIVKKTSDIVLNAVISAVVKQTGVYRNTFIEKAIGQMEVDTEFGQQVRTKQRTTIRIEETSADEQIVFGNAQFF